MKVTSAKSEGVISYTIKSDMNWLILMIKCGLIGAAVLVLKYQMSWWKAAALVMLALLLRCQVTEGVLAIAGLGLQLERKGRIVFWSDESRFFAKHTILGILINEVFEGFQVNYVLQIVINHANEMSLIFPQLRPGLPMIKEVWQNIHILE